MSKEPPIQQYATPWGQDEVDQLSDVLEGNTLVEGVKVKEFEKKFAEYVGAKYCVLMPNATLALYASLILIKSKLKSPNIRIPNFGYIEVFDACIMAGLTPVLADVKDTGVLELRDQEAGVAIHFNGRKAKPTLLEVCFDSINYHTKGLISVYDFNYYRLLTLGGKGGAICTDDEDEYNVLLRLKDHGKMETGSQDYDLWGVDLQVTELQAAFGLAQLEILPRKIETIAMFYKKIKDEFNGTQKIILLSETPTMYVDIYTKEPLKLGQFLTENGIIANRLPKPLHMQPICKMSPRVDTNFTFSNILYNAGLFLPSSPIMDETQINKIISVLKDFVKIEN
jgi:perosamine synthetase